MPNVFTRATLPIFMKLIIDMWTIPVLGIFFDIMTIIVLGIFFALTTFIGKQYDIGMRPIMTHSMIIDDEMILHTKLFIKL